MAYLEHIQYIIDNYSIALQSTLCAEGIDVSIDQAINTLLACDTSPGKKLVDWLVKTYIVKGFRWEDVEIGAESKLAEILGMYQTHFNQIPRDQRNIYLYNSYGALYKLVKPYIPEVSLSEETLGSREIKRRERTRALEESRVLYRSDDMIVAVPLTENAAVWWGRGTKWCTAALKNNYFNIYNENAPLIVITLLNQKNFDLRLNPYSARNQNSQISPGLSLSNESSSLINTDLSKGVQKFQLWAYKDDIQFMDESDCAVTIATIKENWHLFEPVFNQLIKKNGHVLSVIPNRFKTFNICMSAIKAEGAALSFVPDHLKTLEMCRLAVDKSISALKYVPEKYKTNAFYQYAIEQDGEALAYIPDRLKTWETCLKAVERSGKALRDVPYQLKNYELCKKAVEHNGSALDYVPQQHRTTELCCLAVKDLGIAITNIPEEYQTPELLLTAVKNNPASFRYLSKGKKTLEVCKQAVENCSPNIFYVPMKYITNELCKFVIEQGSQALPYIPYEFRTVDICRLAVEKIGTDIKHVPLEVINDEICKAAVKQNGQALNYIPDEFRTPELVRLAEIIGCTKKLEVNWNQSDLAQFSNGLNQYFENKKEIELSINHAV